jgi:16S rRNA (guanine527-N7)-methyltransferase
MSEAVIEVLTDSRHLGFLGERPIDEVVDHARGFVDALEGITGNVVDLGAGGGVPGFVIAHDRPDLHLTMIDRRAKRTDFLHRMVLRLRWSERVEVVTDDVDEIIVRSPGGFDAAVARGFGPPDVTLSAASRLVRPGGRIVISEPPAGDRWPPEVLADLGVRRFDGVGTHVVVFHRHGFT